MENQIEYSKFIIQRYDHYISGANTKGNFLLAFNTFLVGGIIANFEKLQKLVQHDWTFTFLNILLIILFGLCIITTIIVIRAVYPFLNSGNSSKERYHSHIFFNSVADFENESSFNDSFSNQTDEQVKEDLTKQTYQLATGLKRKFKFLENAMRFVFIELSVIILLLLLIIIF